MTNNDHEILLTYGNAILSRAGNYYFMRRPNECHSLTVSETSAERLMTHWEGFTNTSLS